MEEVMHQNCAQYSQQQLWIYEFNRVILISQGFVCSLFTVMMVMLDIAVLQFYSSYVGEIFPTNIKYNNRKIKMSHARCVVLSMVLMQLLDVAILLTLLCIHLWKCIAFTEWKNLYNLL